MDLLMLDTPNDLSKVTTFAAVVNIAGNASLNGVNLMFYYMNHFVCPHWSAIFEEIIKYSAGYHSIGWRFPQRNDIGKRISLWCY